jgi:hypothetical protein
VDKEFFRHDLQVCAGCFVQHSFRFSSDPLLLYVKSFNKLGKKIAVERSE